MPLHMPVRPTTQPALRTQPAIKPLPTQSPPRHPTIHLSTPKRPYGSGPNPTPGRSPLKVWPFILITLIGTASYTYMVRSRAGSTPKPKGNTIGPA